MKTAISLPDDVFEQAEQLARRLNKSRSELYREAVPSTSRVTILKPSPSDGPHRRTARHAT